MDKLEIVGDIFQFLLIGISLVLMFCGGLKFFIISLIFFGGGGFFEFLIMHNFFSKGHNKISKKDSLITKFKNSFLWVHGILIFIFLYNTTIYDFKKNGFLLGIISYGIMLFYVLISFILYNFNYGYFSFIPYLIPIVLNLYSFFGLRYFICKIK
jgi:hypothetical protein